MAIDETAVERMYTMFDDINQFYKQPVTRCIMIQRCSMLSREHEFVPPLCFLIQSVRAFDRNRQNRVKQKITIPWSDRLIIFTDRLLFFIFIIIRRPVNLFFPSYTALQAS